MARDFIKGHSHRNFRIEGTPPLNSYQYDFVRGLPDTTPPQFPRKRKTSDAQKVYDTLGSVDSVSATDFDAATRWMNNFAEQVAYTLKVHKDALDPHDLDVWTALWKRWLLLGARVKQDNELGAPPSSVLPNLLPSMRLSRGVMNPGTKLEYDKLLNESIDLYRDFRRKGLSQVAIPYMGDLVVMLRTLPSTLTLAQMVTRMREASRAGERLLDENTAWWQWRGRADAGGLRRAIAAARELASKFEQTSKLRGQKGPREKGSFAYDLFLRAVTRIPIEAAGLYGIEETLATVRAELKDGIEHRTRSIKADLVTATVIAVLGYMSYKWWTKPQAKLIVEPFKGDYHPEVFDIANFDYQAEGEET